ncbi:MAG: hypothetical protein AAF986_11095, partial [Pseudomonadota bacterium]
DRLGLTHLLKTLPVCISKENALLLFHPGLWPWGEKPWVLHWMPPLLLFLWKKSKPHPPWGSFIFLMRTIRLLPRMV